MAHPETTLAVVLVLLTGTAITAAEPIDIGSRLELLVDEFLIETMTDARLELHRPVRRDIVFRTDKPWEGNASLYQSVFKDGDIYRMYYRGGHYRHSGKPAKALTEHPWVLCYAESKDGIHWRRPDLNLFEFNGSTENNIILTPDAVSEIGADPAHTAVFRDSNPDCPADEKYKIVIVGHEPRGLYVLGSADGIRFSTLSDQPAVTEGAFDSQNLMFWDPANETYREYHRGFRNGVRDIMTASSDNILQFPNPEWLEYPQAPTKQLYTNQVQPYYRAPHILMGFPMRYNDRHWSQPVLELPELNERLARAEASRRYGTAITDAVFMTSRDGQTFKRWPEAFIRPGPRNRETWVYGDNFVFWGMVETKSHLENAPPQLSLYATEGYWEGVDTKVRRYTMRMDGFVSASAPYSGGEIVTKPIISAGGNLALNMATSAAGSIQVELQDPDGTPIDGYTLKECEPIFADSLRHIVRWKYSDGDLRRLAGQPMRIRFVLKDADLYSFQFVPWQPLPDYPDITDYGGIPNKNQDREPFVALEDDFEAVEAETSPTDANLNPGIPEEGSGWHIDEGCADRVQVLNDAPPGSGQVGDNQYLKAERRDESASEGGRAWLQLSPRDAADTTNSRIELTARIYVPADNESRVDIDACDNPAGKYKSRAFQARFWPDGRVTCYTDKDGVQTVPNLSIRPNTWQHVSISADLQTATFDLTVEEKSATGLPFGEKGVHRIQGIAFAPNTNNCTMYIDDVRVRVIP